MHLNRVDTGPSGQPRKNHTMVALCDTVTLPCADGSFVRAGLRGVVVHTGTAMNGHYTAFVRLRATGDWWFCDGADSMHSGSPPAAAT